MGPRAVPEGMRDHCGTDDGPAGVTWATGTMVAGGIPGELIRGLGP